MAVTIKDVAECAGVSKMAVSAVLSGGNPHVRVSDATRARILAAAADCGYQPNRIARSLRTRRTDTVALMIAGFRNPFYTELIESAENLLLAENRQTLVMDTGADSYGTRTGRTSPIALPIDGALMWAGPHQTAAMYLGSQAERIPVVYLGHPRAEEWDFVTFDLYDGASQAIRHLLTRGRRRLAFVCPPFFPDWYLADPRYRAFRDRCAEAGIEARVRLLGEAAETGEAGRRFGEAMAAQPEAERPDALLCMNDAIAVGVYHGLRRGGVRVPEEIALIGFDGVRDGQLLDRPLTTVLTPPEALCRAALDILRDRLNGVPAPARQVTLPVTLLVGETT